MAFMDKDKISYLEYEGNLEDVSMSFQKEEREEIRVVFMGTPSFAVPILEGLIEHYQVVMVVCQPDKKKDRKGNVVLPDTKKIALEYGIPVFQPQRIQEDYHSILEVKPDIIITCAYGQIIPKEVIQFPKYGCINVHGSLLPELRGGAPIHWAIIRGFQETGITIMAMSEQMDAGDIIKQASLKIEEDDILDSLYQKMSYLGRDLLLVTLPSIIQGTCDYVSQDETKVTFGYNISKSDEKISFENSCTQIRNLVRGLNSVPGAYCFLEHKRMKVYEVEILKNQDCFKRGEYGEIVAVDKDGMIVCCLDGFVKIKDIALEGKKRCKVQDYFHGVSSEKMIGKVLE